MQTWTYLWPPQAGDLKRRHRRSRKVHSGSSMDGFLAQLTMEKGTGLCLYEIAVRIIAYSEDIALRHGEGRAKNNEEQHAGSCFLVDQRYWRSDPAAVRTRGILHEGGLKVCGTWVRPQEKRYGIRERMAAGDARSLRSSSLRPLRKAAQCVVRAMTFSNVPWLPSSWHYVCGHIARRIDVSILSFGSMQPIEKALI